MMKIGTLEPQIADLSGLIDMGKEDVHRQFSTLSLRTLGRVIIIFIERR
jgi:hypothetical protein